MKFSELQLGSTVAVAGDEDHHVLEAICSGLEARGLSVLRHQPVTHWVGAGLWVGEQVSLGVAAFGIVMCYTGTGVCIAANKIGGIRAALCTDAGTAAGARRYNDANVLAMSFRLVSEVVALEIVEAFVMTEYDQGEEEFVSELR